MRSNPVNFMQLISTRLLVGLVLLSSEGIAQEQTRVGNWQLHVPYRQGKAVEEARDKIYTVVEQGLFYYDKTFNATETLTKNDGLRNQNISAIRYDKSTNSLVIAYASTHLDLLLENDIVSINDIFRRNIPGEKAINSIYIHNKLAYLACSFGIVVLDLVKQEIRATYSNLGANGEQVSIKSTSILNDSIYATSTSGVLAASIKGVNLQDFRNWQYKSQGLPALGSNPSLAIFNGKVYISTQTGGIYKLSDGQWQQTDIASGVPVLALRTSENYLVATTPGKIYLLDKQNVVSEVANAKLASPKEAVVGEENDVWVADAVQGLVKLDIAGKNATAFAPEGPYAGTAFKLYAANGKVYVLSGGYDGNYAANNATNGFYTYENGNWESFNRQTTSSFPAVQDVVSGTLNPVTGHFYAASYSSGLLEWKADNTFTVYNASNSPLLATGNTEAVRVTDVAVDNVGRVWVVNRNQLAGAPGLFSLSADKTWQAYTIPGAADGTNLEHIVLDDLGYKWLSISRKDNTRNGLLVYDDTSQQLRYFTTGAGNGNLPDGGVYAMAKDLNGDIWVGTGNGVAVFYNPGAAFNVLDFDAHKPIINRRPLLEGQVVRAIAIDGANRKWIGTDNGLWLFGPDGDELVQHFTTANSPLPSGKVVSVAVEHRTGSVFVATETGIASYRAGVTITEGTPDCAVVFPNPVQRNYTGVVAISNLPNNAEVHITDIAGKLIYKTRATGGTATWNVRDYNGKRATAGVYLVMSSDADGKQTCISKIAVLQ